METLDEVSALFKQLEDAAYYSDAAAVTALSRQIHSVLNSIGEAMLAEPGQRVDAANVFLSSAEVVQTMDFHAAVVAIRRGLQVLGDAAREANEAGDLRQAADIFRKIGDVHGEMLEDAIEAKRHYLQVIDCSEKALKFSEGLTRPVNEALYNQYFSLAELHFLVDDLPKAENAARVAIEASKKAGKYYMVATSYKLLLQVALRADRREELVRVFYEARDYFEALLQGETGREKKANFMQIAEIYHVFASFYDLLEGVAGFAGGFAELSKKEAECYIDIANDYERQADDIGSALHYHSAGLVLKKIHDYNGARDAFNRSARHYEAAGELDSAADNYIEASNCMEAGNEFLETIKFIQRANMLYTQAGFMELVIAHSYRALDIHDYLVPEKTILRPSILKMLTDALGSLAAAREGAGNHRDAAQYLVELARVAFQEKDIARCNGSLRQAMDSLKVAHSTSDSGNAAVCNDMLAIVVIGLLLERDDDVSRYIDLLRIEGTKSQVGRDFAGVALHLASGPLGGRSVVQTATRARIAFNNPMLRNLLEIWDEVHESRRLNR